MLKSWRISGFKPVVNDKMLLYFLDLTLTGSEFHRVAAATEKAIVPTFVLTLGTKSRLE